MEFTKVIGLNQQKIQRISWQTTGNGDIMNSSWGLASGKTLTSDSEKDYTIDLTVDNYGAAYRLPSIVVSSTSKFSITVDWGDSTKETYDSIKRGYAYWRYGEIHETKRDSGYYTVRFVPNLKYPFLTVGVNNNQSPFKNEEGIQVHCYEAMWDMEKDEPYNGIQHTYSDNKKYDIVVTINNDQRVTTFGEYCTHNMEWPFLELPYLTTFETNNTYKTSYFKFSQFVFLESLTSFVLSTALSSSQKLTYIPDTFFDNLVKLSTLNLRNSINTTSSTWWDDMNMDRIARLTNLTMIQLSANKIDKFPEVLTRKSYNTIELGTTNDGDNVVYEDVTFNYTINYFADACGIYGGTDYNGPVLYKRALTDYSQENNVDLSNIYCYYGTGYGKFPYATREEILAIPDTYDRLWGIRQFWQTNVHGNNPTVERFDNMVEALYNRTIQHPMASTEDGHRNQWYSVTNYLNGNFNIYNRVPSGTYQAPTGFVQGESNGTPASAMEMIYVLTHNYAQTWNITGGLPSANSISLFSEDPNDQVYSAKVYNNGKYKLSQNVEGNYIYSAPDVTTFGVMRGSTIEFDTIQELADYVSQQNLYVINQSDIDTDLKEQNDYGVL